MPEEQESPHEEDHHPEFIRMTEEDEWAPRGVTFFEMFFRVGFLVVTWSFIVQFVPRGVVVAWLCIWAYRLGRDLLWGVARKSSCASLILSGVGWLVWGTMVLFWLG